MDAEAGIAYSMRTMLLQRHTSEIVDATYSIKKRRVRERMEHLAMMSSMDRM